MELRASVGWFALGWLALCGTLCAQNMKPAQYNTTRQRQAASGNTNTSQNPINPKGMPQPDKGKPEAKRIWSDLGSPGGARKGDCYLRRVMELPDVDKSYVEVECPTGGEVYFNGRRVRTIKPRSDKERIETTDLVRTGKNCLAIRVFDPNNDSPGVRVDFYFKPMKGNWRIVTSDTSWLATKLPIASWQMIALNDDAWMAAIDLDKKEDLINTVDSEKPAETIENTSLSIAARDKSTGSDGPVARPKKSDSASEVADANRDRRASMGRQADTNSETNTDRDAEMMLEADMARDTIAARDKGTARETDTDTATADASLVPPAPRKLPASTTEDLRRRFTTVPGFSVEQVAGAELGSLLAMTFNEFGHIIASVEGGGLVLLFDSDRDGVPDRTRNYCTLVQNVQGILALNGDVYVTGEGEEGSGLYRLIDADRNGELERSELLARFQGIPGEHGAHQIALGPDGFLYISLGNQVLVDRAPDEKHSLAKPYEGDVVRPRFEDPGGHASGVKAPGGTVVRYDLTQRKISIVAGGLRNAYDLAFHPNGSLYLHDSDMEADIGSAWHRPTGLFRIVEGGEYGWRSGWANWPDYYLDRLPSLADTGRGSPTGIAVYNHHQFPVRYHRAIFSADWSEGRIIALPIDAIERGQVKAEDFVVGTPMNVTDLEVGPDGGLYFCTGGRGTEGGIFRIQWQGEVPESHRNIGEGISKAVRQPQFYSAFGRQNVAILKREIGDAWDEQILGVAYSDENPARYRMQALDMMQLLGPTPSVEMLVDLSKASNEQVRCKCARLLGLYPEDESGIERLKRMMGDSSPIVRTAVCEALIRAGAVCDVSDIQTLLSSDIRDDRYLGRRLLMNVPVEAWKDKLLNGKGRTAIQAALALVAANPTIESCKESVASCLRVSQGFVSDADFLDLIRTMQVAMSVGNVQPDDVPQLSDFVQREFPTGNSTINGELIRLATYLRCDLVAPCVEYLKMDVSMSDRMLIAMHLPLMPHSWIATERMAVLQFLESCLKQKTGGSYPLYIMKTSEAISKHLTEREALQILELGQKYPNAALAALFKIENRLTEDQIELLKSLDSAIDKGGLEDDVYKRLKTGITAVLSQQDSDVAVEYLQQRWRKSPDRRASIALALAQKPTEGNWDYLVRSIGILELFAVPDVCNALMKIDAVTEDAEVIRKTILQGCRMVEANQDPAPILQLLEYWTEQRPQSPQTDSETPMTAWQVWFAERYPEAPPAVLPSEKDPPRWSPEFLEQFLNGEQGREGSAVLGAAVYAKARCSACHKMNTQGGGFGPDLTSMNRRFTRSEALESILFPSHVISDQYASKKVLTKSGEVHTGIVIKTSKGISIRVNENKEFMIPDDEIDEIAPSKTSSMPAGLLDDLSPTEIRDLMCFLGFIPEEKQAAEKSPLIRR